MNKINVLKVLKNDLKFSDSSINKLDIFHSLLLAYNKSYNLISKSTESEIWTRHILDSAQIVNLINFKNHHSLSDLGSGAGFPGIIIAIYNTNKLFHVKLYEKSIVKCNFLRDIVKKCEINAEIYEGHFNRHIISSEYVVCRAFKKLGQIIDISREIVKVNHKLIILKGKKAEKEINSLSVKLKYRYELINSITDNESKILKIDIEK